MYDKQDVVVELLWYDLGWLDFTSKLGFNCLCASYKDSSSFGNNTTTHSNLNYHGIYFLIPIDDIAPVMMLPHKPVRS